MEELIHLSKGIISNQKAQEIADGTRFNEVTLSEEKFDDEKIKNIYLDLFYVIILKGKNSHDEIVTRSHEYVYPEVNENLDGIIKSHELNLLEKNEELQKLNTPDSKNHPFFQNGTFIQEGDLIHNIAIGNKQWFIQDGFKRQIHQAPEDIIAILRQTLREYPFNAGGQYVPLNLSPYFKLATPTQINQIDEAQDIKLGNHLSTDPITSKSTQNFIFSNLKVEFECFGVERWYDFTNNQKALLGGISESGYWSIDPNGSCEIQYLTDTDPSENFEPNRPILTWGPTTGRYKQRRISRDESLYIPGDSLRHDFYDPEENPPNVISNYQRPSEYSYYGLVYYPETHTVKEWGGVQNEPGTFGHEQVGETKFPSVVHVKPGSRIKVKLFEPKNDDGDPIWQGWTLLNGIDTSEETGDPTTFKFYDRQSDHGTRMINNECYGPQDEYCWGKITQNVRHANDETMAKLLAIFNDPSHRYYKKSYETDTYGNRTLSGLIYGQPIIKVRGKLSVFLSAYRKGGKDWNVFRNLEDGGVMREKDRNLEDEVMGYTAHEHVGTDGFVWTRPAVMHTSGYQLGETPHINNPKLYYPGLQGIKINATNTDLDPNPEGWSHDLPKAYGPEDSLFYDKPTYGVPYSRWDGTRYLSCAENPFNQKAGLTGIGGTFAYGVGSNYGQSTWLWDHLELKQADSW